MPDERKSAQPAEMLLDACTMIAEMYTMMPSLNCRLTIWLCGWWGGMDALRVSGRWWRGLVKDKNFVDNLSAIKCEFYEALRDRQTTNPIGTNVRGQSKGCHRARAWKWWHSIICLSAAHSWEFQSADWREHCNYRFIVSRLMYSVNILVNSFVYLSYIE